MNKCEKEEEVESEEVETFTIGNSLQFFFGSGCQYAARRRCDLDANIYSVKIDYVSNEKTKSGKCFCLTGEAKEIINACIGIHDDIKRSLDPRMCTFMDCCRSTHEHVLETTPRRSAPVHLYFDLELDASAFKPYDIPPDVDRVFTEQMLKVIVRHLSSWMLNFDPETMLRDVICMSSTRPKKYSMHILFKNIVMPSVAVVQQFALYLRDTYKTFSPFSMYKEPIIDFGVYKLHASLRMVTFAKSYTSSQWDFTRRCPKKDYPTFPLIVVDPPLYPAGNRPCPTSRAAKILHCSIGMDREALAVINCVPIVTLVKTVRSKPTYDTNRKRNNRVEIEEEGERILTQMYENIPIMSYWPRDFLTKSFKNIVNIDSVEHDTMTPDYVFEFMNDDHTTGLPCFRDDTFFQPHSVDPENANREIHYHRNSQIQLYVFIETGEVKQVCWPHSVGYRWYAVGNYKHLKRSKINESFNDVVAPNATRSIGTTEEVFCMSDGPTFAF